VSVYPYLVAVWLFVCGLYGVITSRNYIHAVVSIVVMQSSTDVLLLAVGYVHGARAPIFSEIPSNSVVVDPVVQALTLTDVVVEATVVALLLALIVQAHKRYDTLDPDRMNRMSE
jgi:multicomponent Na+:H+ antiporter subunit C